MTVVFFIFVGLVIFHFVWEGIIAPSFRLEIRYELFKLRDELRKLRIEHGEQINDGLFDWLQGGINKGIRLLHAANIENIYKAYHEVDRAEIEKLERMINDCPVTEARDVFEKTAILIGLAVLVNSGGWFAYIIPLLFSFLGFKALKNAVKKLFGLSETDFNKMFPPRQAAT